MTCIANYDSNKGKIIQDSECRCEKCYKEHGEGLYKIGKRDALRKVLKTEIQWSVGQIDKDFPEWTLETIIVGDGTLENIKFVNRVLDDNSDYQDVITFAKDGTVKSIWLAADENFKKAQKQVTDYIISSETAINKLRKFNI